MSGLQLISNASNTLQQAQAAATTASTAATTSTSSSTSSANDNSDITSSDFLTLLVSEMKNQDPTQPTDPDAYIQQLVGVNSLQQLVQINQDLSGATSSSGSGSGSTSGAGSTNGVTT